MPNLIKKALKLVFTDNGLLNGNLGALTGDAGDYGDTAGGGGDEGLNDGNLLGLGEEGAFAGVAQDHQGGDLGEGAQPRAEALNGGEVDLAVRGEGGDGGGVEAAEIGDWDAHGALAFWSGVSG